MLTLIRLSTACNTSVSYFVNSALIFTFHEDIYISFWCQFTAAHQLIRLMIIIHG